VCLLIAVVRPGADVPLVVGANRDERTDRPAVSCTVLAEHGPRILGGRDLLAGGTWLAVNEHGVVAGLTNAPVPGGRDDSKRSRGELPLLAAGAPDAAGAVRRLAESVDPSQYYPAWMLVGDRTSLYAVSIDGPAVTVVSLAPGLHVLENRPPGEASVKVDHVTAALGKAVEQPGPDAVHLLDRLAEVLADNAVPEEAAAEAPYAGRSRRPELAAACVHADGYGTRSSALIAVPAQGRPRLAVADGPPCSTAFVDQTWRWEAAPAGS
jgi:uncharacterized protein with NRDE domain